MVWCEDHHPALLATTNHALSPPWLNEMSFKSGRTSKRVGLNETEFEQALKSRKYREAHQRALRLAYEEAGGTGVPMFVIGDRTLTGLQDRATLEAVFEKELVRSEKELAASEEG